MGDFMLELIKERKVLKDNSTIRNKDISDYILKKYNWQEIAHQTEEVYIGNNEKKSI